MPPSESPEPDGKQAGHRWPVHLGLLLLTIVSVFWAWTNWALNEGEEPSLSNMYRGWTFAVPMMTILLAHELGHYIAAKIHKVPASMPYFIPMPFSPFGIWGADHRYACSNHLATCAARHRSRRPASAVRCLPSRS
ncbi:MAG: hypothetical protein U0165_07120 [Polyangiaceae bacterium]